MKKLIFLVFASVVALLAVLYFKLGADKPVSIALEERGPYSVIFKPHLGAYYKIVPTIEEIEKWAKANGIGCKLTFGEYFDDPEKVDEDRLRSRAGCILETAPPMVMPKDYSVGSIPMGRFAVAIFEGAPSLGPVKVYPQVFEFLDEQKLSHSGSIIEIYEILPENKVRTTYLFLTAEGLGSI
ncbi:MAG: GyrI-like domain-containing protein [Bdellovibrionota bacterium]